MICPRIGIRLVTSMKSKANLHGGFKKPSRIFFWGPVSWLWFLFKGAYRHARIHRIITRALGPQYTRNRNQIEIDITYRCNLKCLNCNRSTTRAPQMLDINIDAIHAFIYETKSRGIRWRRIRVLGGEPTLHPHFHEIINLLRSYRESNRACSIEIVTNGYGEEVNVALSSLPDDIWIENSRKTPGPQRNFRPFSCAPIDDNRYAHASFANGCQIMSACGMGLTPLGYFPCAIAGGIDRIVQDKWGRQSLPDESDDMSDILLNACRLCGRFKDGHYIPEKLREPLTKEAVSPTWNDLYAKWEKGRGEK